LVFPRGFYVEEVLPVVLLLSPVTGFILSIAGLVTAKREGKSGKGFGIAGVALPSVAAAAAILIIALVIFGNMGTKSRVESSELYHLGGMGKTLNTEYDVSKYKMPEGYDFNSLNITVSKTELETYAVSNLQTISQKSDKSIRGIFQDYSFLIVRSDCFDEWLKANSPKGLEYYNAKGYTMVTREEIWEFGGIRFSTLAVYKDPSDRFIIITNCDDHKIIAEFFEGIGVPVPTETTVEETVEETEEKEKTELQKRYEQADFLRKNTNTDMSLLEIISVFEKTCGQPPDKDLIIFKHGVGNFSTNGYSGNTQSSNINFYCFGLARQFKTEDGKYYQIRVEVLSGLNQQNRSFKLTQITNTEVDGDFFDYIRNSDAYKYASTAQIRNINIYITEI
jgi:hypothetical protein